MMAAHIAEEDIILIRNPRWQHRAHAYRAVCDDCTWQGDLHAVSVESAPHFAAICDAEDHDETEHGIAT